MYLGGLPLESPAGKLYHTYASRGHLLPDDVTIKIWHNYVGGLIATNRYFPAQQLLLLDGGAPHLKQAEIISSYIEVVGIIVLAVDNIEVLIKRMQRRAIIEKRHDDADEHILRTRMEVYQKETTQLLDHYPSKIISCFNADQRPLEVLRDVLVCFSHILA